MDGRACAESRCSLCVPWVESRPVPPIGEGGSIRLGTFSVSLNVADIQASKSFYENLGFQVCGGDISQNWLILRNGNCTIGLFQGMIEKNTLTFNPGWDENGNSGDITRDY